MDLHTVLRIFVFSIPVYSAITCGMIFFVAYRQKVTLTESLVKRLLMIYYTLMAFIWLSIVILAYFPYIFVYLSPVYYLGTMFLQVLFYHFIFTLTRTGNRRQFFRWHYLIPATVFAVTLAISAFIPFDIHLRSGYVERITGNISHMHLFASPVVVHILFLYTTTYIVLSLYSLYRYYKAVREQYGDSGWKSMRWFVMSVILKISLWISSFLATYMVVQTFTSFFMLPTIVILVVQHIIIAYNVLRGNYILLIPDRMEVRRMEHLRDRELQVRSLNGDRRKYNKYKIQDNLAGKPIPAKLTKDRFEEYIKKNKPFLNPELTIMDLVTPLEINRSYLSAFINKTYGVNFKSYINRCRLNEFNRLMRLPSTSQKDVNKIVVQAGFGSLRSYQRVKKQEEENGFNRT